ncbi:uncharacterized protein LOC143424054 [Xylocopa sonorina]|uniref:uncharacterized protein LOC143424054 n=1 Tax=Xylocopa sonorina TaxID=1818115 RepID=UPI00403B11EF
MWNSEWRKVKSLNDIPEVFGTYDHTETKVSKASLEKIINKHSGELDQKKIGILFSRRMNLNVENHFHEKQEFSEDANNNEKNSDTDERFKNAKALKTKVNEQVKIDQVDATNSLNTFQQKKSLREYSKRKLKKRFLAVIDMFLLFVLLTPTIVAFWMSTWTYMEIHEDIFPGWLIFTLGTLLHTAFAIFKNYFHDYAIRAATQKPWSNRILFKSMQILYMYVFSIVCIMQWNGGFIIFNHFIQPVCTRNIYFYFKGTLEAPEN